LHLFTNGNGFQTWELSPVFALRSWAYIIVHFLPARLGLVVGGGLDKVCHDYGSSCLSAYPSQRIAFFAVRLFLGVVSALIESAFYRSVVENVNQRVGRYLFFMLAFSAGMWNSATGARHGFSPFTFHLTSCSLPSIFVRNVYNCYGL
jgi:alpha-1,2-mannosyltransferase